ncbi:MAG TPA: AAA family ATPase [Solirubrobacteraceae bacterium]|nr:AAA family ATPase [Solirubrobacteraceae bacterium]
MLYGRQAECRVVERLLRGARESKSGALVVRGEPGVGKTALVSYAAARARDMRVLRCVGTEAESELAFSALHQLLRPVVNLLDRVPEPQATALAGALGLTPGSREDRFLIAVGALSLLAEAAEEQPLLCLVDDAQWLDHSSADALAFVSRRIEAEGIVLLFAARDGEARRFEAAGIAELELRGLDETAAAALLADCVEAEIAPHVNARLLGATAGNPLALIELAALLSEQQLAGREPIADPLPQGAGIESAFLQQARRLPADAQSIVLLAAAEGTGRVSTTMRAAALLDLGADSLDAAEASGLVVVKGSTLEFRHPLVRSAVYQGATFAQRQAIHRALADVLDRDCDADRRAWHRAAATLDVDDSVADELERAAARARARSGFAAAARALERAADLASADAARASHLTSAAGDAWLAGRPDWALALADRADAVCPDARRGAELAHLRGTIELRCGVPAEALRILARGADDIAPVDPATAIEMLIEAAQAASYTGDAAQIVEMGNRASALIVDDQPGTKFTIDVIVGIGKLFTGDPAGGLPMIAEAVRLAQRFDDPRRLVHAGACAHYMGDDESELRLYTRAVERTREIGAVGTLPYVLEYLARAEAIAGRYARATAHASEGLRLATETGQLNSVCTLKAVLALIAATQGHEDDCRDCAARALEASMSRGLGFQSALARWALARLELSYGRSGQALEHLETIAAAVPGAGHPFIRLMATADLVEAAVRCRQSATAQHALADFERFAIATGLSWALARVARCRALLASGAVAERHYVDALRRHDPSTHPFDKARTELLFGEHLRRAGRRKEARGQLRSALESFESLGASSWAGRARLELRASGEASRKRRPGTADQLTPQELQIVQLVAEGATNKEVASRLFLSPRTVDYHLRKVFVKLGISSRGQLIRLAVDERHVSEQRLEPAMSR